jgi:hypothetical protein
MDRGSMDRGSMDRLPMDRLSMDMLGFLDTAETCPKSNINQIYADSKLMTTF